MWIERHAARCLAMFADVAAPRAPRRRHGIRPPEQARFMMGRHLCVPVEWIFPGMRANAACRHCTPYEAGEWGEAIQGIYVFSSMRTYTLRGQGERLAFVINALFGAFPLPLARTRSRTCQASISQVHQDLHRPLGPGLLRRVGKKHAPHAVIPAQAGIQPQAKSLRTLDPRLRDDDAGGEATQRASGMQPFHPEGSANGRCGTRNSPAINRDPQLFGKTREGRGQPRPAYAGRPA
jgi:hypothetical protein